jgi:hypothetical protein
MDGLVSTGNKFPSTILNIFLAIQKIFYKNFIHILVSSVDSKAVLNPFALFYRAANFINQDSSNFCCTMKHLLTKAFII